MCLVYSDSFFNPCPACFRHVAPALCRWPCVTPDTHCRARGLQGAGGTRTLGPVGTQFNLSIQRENILHRYVAHLESENAHLEPAVRS